MKHRALRQRGGRQSGGEKARRTTGDLVAAAETGRFYGAHRGRGSVRGAAGGGKSDALVIEALRQVHIPHYRALILRKTYPQLSELIDKTMRYYKPVFPKARYNGSSHCWTFPAGEDLFRQSEPHTGQVQLSGQSLRLYRRGRADPLYLGRVQLCHEPQPPLGTRHRVHPGHGQPGGVGHGWVKARFISPAPAGTRMVQLVKVKAPEGKRSPGGAPASLSRPPSLTIRRCWKTTRATSALASLPEAEKQALLYGNWDSFSGTGVHRVAERPEPL